ncbi:MAG: transcription elongation factor GreA [Candidatus Pacebacteria bacterium]|nr:transcription elongation factor GreA [Candidatus Paceibacterota bacterium]
MEQERLITKEGLEKLKNELDYLKKTRQKEVAEEINKAASYGDLSENAAYHHAKEELSFLRGRIAELEDTIKKSKVIEENPSVNLGKAGAVVIGSIVNVECDGQKEQVAVVSLDEADPTNGKISCQSPLGKALGGKTAGEEVEIETPKGKIKYKIISVE